MLVLDTLDNKILTIISNHELHPSEMERKLGASRTTIQYRLKKIEELGLAKKRTAGKKTLWSAVVRSEHNKNHFRIYKGNDFLQAYKQLLSLPAQTTIISVQGSRAAKAEFSALPEQFIKESHRVFKRKGFVMKGIGNENSLRVFMGIEKSLLQSHVGRTVGIKLFRDTHFLGAGEIFSTKKLLLLSNPTAKQCVVIKDKGITEIVYDILDLMLDILDGRDTFDINHYLRNKIAGN